MVLSLAELSLISISSGIRDGTIQNPHMLPPLLRQQVLDMVLKRGLINHPNCLALLSSVDFLNGMTSISTSAGDVYDGQFIRLLTKSMASKLPTGGTVGAAMKKLDLCVYGCSIDYNKRNLEKSNFPTVSTLIAKCTKVTSMDFRGLESDGPFFEVHRFGGDYRSPWLPCVLNTTGVCKPVLENLVELSIRTWMDVLGIGRPIIDFKQLRILNLDCCSVQMDLWPDFLRKVPTLEYLDMVDVYSIGRHERGLDWVLPFSMPHLKSLKINGNRYSSSYNCNKVFVDNLIGCPELCQVHLILDEKSTDEASLNRLADMEIDLKIKFRITVFREDDDISAVLDSSSKFKVVRILHEKMDSIELLVHSKWSPQLSTALEDIATTCSNLTTFHLRIPEFDHSLPGRAKSISKEEIKRVNAALVQFFGNWDRAVQLEDLRLNGNFDETVMSAIFENCLGLAQLEISQCPNLRDQHLVDWVSRDGGKLSRIIVFECKNVTSEGIIPILVKSAERLLGFNFCKGAGKWGRNWEKVLDNRCPNAQIDYRRLS